MKHLITLAAGVVMSVGVARADTLIHAGRLIDGKSERAATEVTLRINGETIAGIEPGYTPPGNGDTVIDLRNETVLPGLMDMHVHLTSFVTGRRPKDGEFSSR